MQRREMELSLLTFDSMRRRKRVPSAGRVAKNSRRTLILDVRRLTEHGKIASYLVAPTMVAMETVYMSRRVGRMTLKWL
jgi:hypothetical protein